MTQNRDRKGTGAEESLTARTSGWEARTLTASGVYLITPQPNKLKRRSPANAEPYIIKPQPSRLHRADA